MSNISSIDLNLLKVLLLLSEELSVTRASARLGQAQGTVSADLKKLRVIFDDQLFTRHSRGLKPTPRMDVLAPQLRAVMRSLEGIVKAPVFNPRTASHTFRIVAGDYSEWVILPKLCAILAEEAPGLRIAVVHHVMGRAQKMFEVDELDFAISVPRLTAPWLQQISLVEDPYCIVARKDHPRLKNGTITLDRFCAEMHAVTVRDENIFEPTTTDRALLAMGRKRHQMFLTRNYSSALRIIEQTDLIGMGLRGILPIYPNLQAFPVPFEIAPMRLLLSWHERFQNEPAHVWLRRRLAEIVRSKPAARQAIDRRAGAHI